MHINFKYIRWKNLLSTGNAWIEIPLDTKPSTLIIGVNGSGKSTFLDAISLALFGKPFRNIRKNQLINTINKKDCVVEIEFNVGVKIYKVVRGINPNIFEVWSDGLMLNQNRDSKDYQLYLEKFILGMNQKTFNQIVIAGAAQYVPFMQLSAADRRAFIEDLLDIQVFSVMSNIVKSRISENKTEIEKIKILLDSKMDKEKMIRKNLIQVESTNMDKIAELCSEIRLLSSDKNTISNNATTIAAQLTTQQALLVDESKIRTKITKMQQLKTKIETNRDTFLHKHEFLDKNEDCPTCKQKIEEEFKINEQCRIDVKVQELNKGLIDINKDISSLEASLVEFDAIRSIINQCNKEFTIAENEIRNITSQILKKEKEIKEIEKGSGIIESLYKDMHDVEIEMESLSNTHKELIEQKTVLGTASDLLKDGGIKTNIIKQYISIINQNMNKYLHSLGFLAQFELDETFNEKIKSRYRDEFSYDNFSEGEKMRIDLSLMLTWRAIAKSRNSASANLLILDEVFDGSLDDTGIEDFLKIMNSLTADTNVFVISHKQDQMIDKFSRVYKAEKKRNYSVITEI